MNKSEINDLRTPAEFKTFSFSRFKKTKVRDQLVENMQKGKVEPACYWSAELICAGHFMDLWEIILYYVGKHIHLGNPKIVSYIEMRFQAFRQIIQQGMYTNELQLRNHPTVRRLFAEIVAVLTFSNRKHSFESIRINRVEEFDMTQMTERLKAPTVKYVEPIFRKEDPKELYIALNEFAYHISADHPNMLNACYWIEWTIDFEIICKNKKTPIYCERRTAADVHAKLQRDVIWMVWETIQLRCKEVANPYIEKIMRSLQALFSIKYTTGSCKKRRYLLYFAVALLTEPVPTNIEITGKKEIVQSVVENIDEIYKQIKKNEESPNMEYLYANMERESNLEKSIKKLELMNTMINNTG
jgi:hypothetical protein